jgi:hypothetical protein
MSNALAIGAVTAVIKDVLENTFAAQNVVPSVNVTTLPPDRVVPANPANNADDNQLNLFFYQITPNAAWRNASYPSRDAGGDRLTNPPLALNLHYFVTAYGQKPFHAEIILGYAMLALHEASVLTREQIKKSLANAVPLALSNCRLVDQVEQIKVTQEILIPEEISKLWSAITAHYRPTAAYQVSVVLMESEQSTKGALPVRSVGPYSIPSGPPLIEAVQSAAGSRSPIVPGSTLHILGQNLKAEQVQVRVDGALLNPQPGLDDITDQRIVYQLPALLPAGVFAGMKPLRVEHMLDLSQPPVPHESNASNVQTFMLRPQIGVDKENVVNSNANGLDFRAGTLKLDFAPEVGRKQNVVVLLNEFNPPADRPARGYSFTAPPENGIVAANQTSTATIHVPFQKVVAGFYLVRVRVDDSESVLQVNASGLYAQPQVDLT